MKILSILLAIGWFSVSTEKQVTFAPGNLQFHFTEGTHSTAVGVDKSGTWRFAASAWESATSPWLDAFGWATSGWDNRANDPDAKLFEPTLNTINNYLASDINCTGYGPSQGGGRSQDLTGNSANYDWGIFNAISNGGNEVGKWRTLLYSEWNYLFYSRKKADELYGFAYIKTPDSIAGIAILPDDWSGEALKEGYSLGEWQNMEAAGAVFLPEGKYWTATGNTTNNNKFAQVLFFHEGTNNDPQDLPEERYNHFPVRLAKDYVDPATGVETIPQHERTTQKILCNGQLLMISGEKIYNTLGQKVH